MSASPSLPALARQLLDDARLSSAEVERRAAAAIDSATWRALAPDLHVGGGAALDLPPLSPEAEARARRALDTDGFFHLRGVVPARALSIMNAAVDAVTRAGWPPAFAFVYDEFWQLARSPALRPLVEGALGPNARQIPYIWVHVVPPVAGAAGWAPHIDGAGGRRLTLWVALTDAPIEAGCMHLVRRGPWTAEGLNRGEGEGPWTPRQVAELVQRVRAMPASAGDVLGWGFDIFHWGGPVEEGSPGRRALSYEFIADGEEPTPRERPLVPLGDLPPFTARLRALAVGLTAFQHFEPMLARFEPVARLLVARLDS